MRRRPMAHTAEYRPGRRGSALRREPAARHLERLIGETEAS